MGLYFGSEARKWPFKKLRFVHLTANQGNLGVSLKSPGLENMPQVSGNRAELGQNHGVRKAVSATISVLK